MTKKEVARILEQIGILLAVKGDNPFKSIAYNRAARIIEGLDGELHEVIERGELSAVRGIGEAISKKVLELVTTGRLKYYEDLRATVPPGHLEMMKIRGLGPKKIVELHKRLGIETIDDLERACKSDLLLTLPGFGKRTQEKILGGIGHWRKHSDRHLYADVAPQADRLLSLLGGREEVLSLSIAGSLRRRNEVVKDIDLLASSDKPAALASFFASLGKDGFREQGETKTGILLDSGIRSDLRIVSQEQFPYALHHFTGSREHNTAMRGRAKRMGMTMNEYGLFSEKGLISCSSEGDLFAALGLAYIPPELRENMGEIAAAERGEIPRLIETEDIRGVFHLHTSASDGSATLETLARAAGELGLEYIGIADHSRSAQYAGGLSIEDVRRQCAEIDKYNRSHPGFRIFKGIEADILPDGSLDYDDETLALFDYVIAAVHSHFSMPEPEMTDRILRGLAHPRTTILAHPTGRLLLSREPYAVDMDRIMDFAAEHGKILELNTNPQRLDLDWRYCIRAKRRGIRIVICPDAHHLEDLKTIVFGINIARKGWMESSDCINTLSAGEMAAFLSSRNRKNKISP